MEFVETDANINRDGLERRSDLENSLMHHDPYKL
jgi:hypothetical protein